MLSTFCALHCTILLVKSGCRDHYVIPKGLPRTFGQRWSEDISQVIPGALLIPYLEVTIRHWKGHLKVKIAELPGGCVVFWIDESRYRKQVFHKIPIHHWGWFLLPWKSKGGFPNSRLWKDGFLRVSCKDGYSRFKDLNTLRTHNACHTSDRIH